MTPKPRWAAAETATLRRLWEEGYTTGQMLDFLPGRSYGSVAGRCNTLRLGRRVRATIQGSRAYTQTEDRLLTELWEAGQTPSEIHTHIPSRTVPSLSGRAHDLGLRRERGISSKVGTGRRWSDAEDEILIDCWTKGLPTTQIMQRLPGRSRYAVGTRAIRRLGLPRRVEWSPRRPWTAEEDAALVEFDKRGYLQAEIAAEMDRTVASIQNRRDLLGLAFRGKGSGRASALAVNAVCRRTLLARTCSDCGELLDGSLFRPMRSKGHEWWSGTCRACDSKNATKRPSRQTQPERKKSMLQRFQDVSVAKATRSHKPWEAWEDAIVRDTNIPLLTVAMQTSRSYLGVEQRAQQLKVYRNAKVVKSRWQVFTNHETVTDALLEDPRAAASYEPPSETEWDWTDEDVAS